MIRTPCFAATAFAAALFVTVVHAQAPGFEITVSGGYRFGGEPELKNPEQTVDIADHTTLAVALDIARDDHSQYELFYSRQATRLKRSASIGPMPLKIEYLQIGGTLISSQPGRIYPYLVGMAGISRVTPESPGTDASTNLSISLGGGVRAPLGRHLSLRLEARGYKTFVDTSATFHCTSGAEGGACQVLAKGSSVLQFELLAGAAFSF